MQEAHGILFSAVAIMWSVIAGVASALVFLGLAMAPFRAALFEEDPQVSWSWPIIGGALIMAGLTIGGLAARGIWIFLRNARNAAPAIGRIQTPIMLLSGSLAAISLTVWIAGKVLV